MIECLGSIWYIKIGLIALSAVVLASGLASGSPWDIGLGLLGLTCWLHEANKSVTIVAEAMADQEGEGRR